MDGARSGRGMTGEARNRLLVRIAHELDGTLNLDQVLGRLLDTLREAVGYDAAGIFLLNREEVFPGYGVSWRKIAATVRRGFDGPLPDVDRLLALGQGLVGHVLKTGECAVASDVSRDPRYVQARPATRSELVVPVHAGGRLVGSMNLDPRSAGKNTELGIVVESPELAKEVLRVIHISKLQSAYRLQFGADGRSLAWATMDDDKEVLLDTEPDTSLFLRVQNLLLAPFVPEQQL